MILAFCESCQDAMADWLFQRRLEKLMLFLVIIIELLGKKEEGISINICQDKFTSIRGNSDWPIDRERMLILNKY